MFKHSPWKMAVKSYWTHSSCVKVPDLVKTGNWTTTLYPAGCAVLHSVQYFYQADHFYFGGWRSSSHDRFCVRALIVHWEARSTVIALWIIGTSWLVAQIRRWLNWKSWSDIHSFLLDSCCTLTQIHSRDKNAELGCSYGATVFLNIHYSVNGTYSASEYWLTCTG